MTRPQFASEPSDTPDGVEVPAAAVEAGQPSRPERESGGEHRRSATADEEIRELLTVDGHTSTRDQAILAVLDLHQPSVLSAGLLPERCGEGRCVFCHHPLIREYQGHLNGAHRKTTMHDHVDPEPWCRTCHGESELENYARYPCPTVTGIAKALGVEP